MIGDLLLRNSQLSPKTIRRSGFRIASVASACVIDTVQLSGHMRDVLTLRRLAYGSVGKADLRAPVEKMSDCHDANAVIVRATHHHRTVGSLRIVFPDDAVPHEYCEVVDLPPLLQDRSRIAAVSRICTHPSYRGSDLFSELVAFADELICNQQRRYAVGGCTPGLLPLYLRHGWQSTGIRFRHHQLNGVEEYLIFKDFHAPRNWT